MQWELSPNWMDAGRRFLQIPAMMREFEDVAIAGHASNITGKASFRTSATTPGAWLTVELSRVGGEKRPGSPTLWSRFSLWLFTLFGSFLLAGASAAEAPANSGL